MNALSISEKVESCFDYMFEQSGCTWGRMGRSMISEISIPLTIVGRGMETKEWPPIVLEVVCARWLQYIV